ncbi:FkbM family methyltransferase [Okeania sp. SIO1I7]|uniref:FkbM family methyltransferase n=1 Tax=Okeania sp. SIO1I7 TaxID=2607772 RepID=UPI0025F05D18|nr:FkbM family methyltransferase [Okeania sp. SIO1I7]
MVRLATEKKITIARFISNLIVGVRAIFGLSSITKVYRRGLHWSLDLKEGIDLAIYLGVYEPETIKELKRIIKPGDVVVDIGANIGALTLPLAEYVGVDGCVIAFEPTSWAYGKLQNNLSLNPHLLNRVRTEQMMLLEEEKELPSFVYSSWNLSASEDKLTHPQHKGRLMTTDGGQGISLDGYFEKHPHKKVDLIKLDVDGYELAVLKGARKLLLRDSPKIILEMARQNEEEEKQLEKLLAELKDAQYRLVHLTAKYPILMTKEAIKKLCPPGGSINVLALPQ